MTQRFLSVCLVMTALVASTNAFASRARQQVMGTADPFGALSEGTHGSFYYDDNYNIFYNPAYVNDFKNWVAIEKANGNVNNVGGAEGGFVYGMQNWAFGLFMNRGGAVSAGFGGYSALHEDNTFGADREVGYTLARANGARPIDLLFGYDLGAAKLGLGITYGYNRAANPQLGQAPSSDNQLQDMSIRLGAQVADFDPFFAIKVIGKDTTKAAGATTVTEVKNTSMTLGTKYHYGEWVPFAYWRRDTTKNSVTNVDLRASAFGLGVGRNTKLGEGTNLNYAVAYHRLSGAGSASTGTATTANTVNSAVASGRSVIPVDLSVEHDMTSWLVARAGLAYRAWDQINGISQGDGTTGRLGLTAKVGKANLDWAIGGGLASNTAAGSAATATNGNVDSQSFDFSNGMFTNLSLTYAW